MVLLDFIVRNGVWFTFFPENIGLILIFNVSVERALRVNLGTFLESGLAQALSVFFFHPSLHFFLPKPICETRRQSQSSIELVKLLA